MSDSLDTRQRMFLDHVRGVSDIVPDLADGPVPATLGLAVYVNAYRARLREALAADHPRLARHLGEARWLALCDAYIDAQPSTVRSLRTFGDRMPEFLARVVSVEASSAAIESTRFQEPGPSRLKSFPHTAAGDEGALLAELASFERCLLDAFDAADAPRLDWTAFETMPAERWPGLRLRLHPSLRHLPLRTHAVATWQSLGDVADGDAVMDVVPAAVFVWRDAARVTRFRAFAANEQAALAGVIAGRDFARICEDQLAFDDVASIPPRMIGWLRAWVDDGLVVARVDVEADATR